MLHADLHVLRHIGAHRRRELLNEAGLLHQARAVAVPAHRVTRAANVDVDLVVAEARAEACLVRVRVTVTVLGLGLGLG